MLRSRPGGFNGSWPYRTYPGTKIRSFSLLAKFRDSFFQIHPLLRIFAVSVCLSADMKFVTSHL
ncbi:MAG TPA: hypothetical protein DDZ96_13830 [Porphyromonadaceae bacterium]|nr:hypothetical protein [Porphyromonadaceae bacterium]